MKLVEIYHRKDGSEPVRIAYLATEAETNQALTEAFAATNNWDHTGLITEHPLCRSTSVGDYVVVDGEWFECERAGWKKLPRGPQRPT